MLRLLPSPGLLAFAAALALGVSVATPQDDEKKSEKLPIPFRTLSATFRWSRVSSAR